jgi:hypothetical protein
MKIFGYILATAFVVAALPAQAGSGSGLVHNIIAHPNGTSSIIMFTLDAHSDAPVCATNGYAAFNGSKPFAFDGSTPDGKNKYALLLAAANAKKPVQVAGTGNCEAWGDRENVLWILSNY